MFDAITFDAVRALRDFATTKLAELLTAVNTRGIKSVQRGILVINASATQASVTISAVTMGKTELRMLGAKTFDVPQMPLLLLESPTTITASRTSTAANTTTISWELTEWN